jgi:hypothetical protein
MGVIVKRPGLPERDILKVYSKWISFKRAQKVELHLVSRIKSNILTKDHAAHTITSVASTSSQRPNIDASRAGGLRGVTGSGQTGYVCGKSSPSSKPGS